MADTPSDLSALRSDLDTIDRRLIDALAERQALVSQVAAVKGRRWLAPDPRP